MQDLNTTLNLGAVAFIAMIAIVAYDCRRDVRALVSARNVYLITLQAWYLLEAMVFPPELKKYSSEIYNFGIVFVFVSATSFLIAYSTSKGGAFDEMFRKLGLIDKPNVIWRVFTIACAVGFLPLLIVARGNVFLILDDAFTAHGRWGGAFQRGRFGGVRDVLLELQMFLRAAVPLAAAIVVQPNQHPNRRWLAALYLIFTGSRVLNEGTRSKVIEVLLPIAAAVYWRFSPHLKRQALMVALPSLAVLGLLWSAATVIGRNQGTTEWGNAFSVEYVGFEMFRELLFLTNYVPAVGDYQYGHTYLVQIVNPIPRFLWPGKPIGDAGLQLATLQDAVSSSGEAYLTISPGLIGEMYWNFGVIGIVALSAFLGYLAKSWDRARPLANKSLLAFTVFAAGLAIIFISGRSFNMPTLYGMLALYALLVYMSRR